MCSTCVLAQQVTVSARVAVTGANKSLKADRADNIVLWLTSEENPLPLDTSAASRSRHLRLTQHNKSFEPHLLVVPVGSVVEFPNRDPFFHNVFSLFEGKRFDLGLYEAGSTRDVHFDKPGISYIFCNIHAEMNAVVIALNTPYFGISNRRGEIVVPHVPAGRYTMRVWSEAAAPETLNAMTREIVVSESNSTLGVLRVPVGTLPQNHKNKYGRDYDPPAPDNPAYEHP